MTNPTRWALVTFLLGITEGIIGHYLPIEASAFIVPVLAAFFSASGAAAISEDNNK